MKSLFKCVLILSAFVSVGLAGGVALADEPGSVTLHTQVVVGHPRRPIVTIEIGRQRPDIPLHALSHPLDQRPAAVPTP
jgi:hypothetical protein